MIMGFAMNLMGVAYVIWVGQDPAAMNVQVITTMPLAVHVCKASIP